jgi:hypothetical protein
MDSCHERGTRVRTITVQVLAYREFGANLPHSLYVNLYYTWELGPNALVLRTLDCAVNRSINQ